MILLIAILKSISVLDIILAEIVIIIFSLKLDYDFFLTFYFQRNEMKGNIQTKKLDSRTEIECLEL